MQFKAFLIVPFEESNTDPKVLENLDNFIGKLKDKYKDFEICFNNLNSLEM